MKQTLSGHTVVAGPMTSSVEQGLWRDAASFGLTTPELVHGSHGAMVVFCFKRTLPDHVSCTVVMVGPWSVKIKTWHNPKTRRKCSAVELRC